MPYSGKYSWDDIFADGHIEIATPGSVTFLWGKHFAD